MLQNIINSVYGPYKFRRLDEDKKKKQNGSTKVI